jgi:small subunit ribosomal protein S17
LVKIEACRKLSKKKAFQVVELVEPARTYTDPDTGAVLR